MTSATATETKKKRVIKVKIPKLSAEELKKRRMENLKKANEARKAKKKLLKEKEKPVAVDEKIAKSE